MPIILPQGLTSAEIRVLQEFRRLTAETLPPETIQGIKHPEGTPAESPATSLARKGFLTGGGEAFTLTEAARQFLAIEAKPLVAETRGADAPAATTPPAPAV